MIEIKNISKSFKGKKVLDQLNLCVLQGEVLAILGPSGCGKSVLLKHIIGLDEPDAGSVFLHGKEVSQFSREDFKCIGMLFQESALFDSLTIQENTAFYLNHHPDPKLKRFLKKEEIETKVNQALSLVGLKNVHQKMPASLSGGMRKRAALARLLVYQPEIILYDEPTNGLDPPTAMHINRLIIQTKEQYKTTSIVVTHDMTSALYIADRLALLRDGKIVHVAPPREFFSIEDPFISFAKKTISQDMMEQLIERKL